MGTILTAEARAWIGRDFGSRTFHVTRDDIRKFALAIREHNPIYFDPEVARQRGYRDVLAPPNFYLSLGTASTMFVPHERLGRDGIAQDDVPPLPVARVMAGQTDVQLLGDICAGDEITVSRQLVDMQEVDGRSGTFAILVYERRYTNQHGELIVHERTGRIVR